jgi:hypothetical protein
MTTINATQYDKVSKDFDETTIWSGNSPVQIWYDKLWELIPTSGMCMYRNAQLNDVMNALLGVSRCYYDLYNNGGCNIADVNFGETEMSKFYRELCEPVNKYLEKQSFTLHYAGTDTDFNNLVMDLACSNRMPKYKLQMLESVLVEIVRHAYSVMKCTLMS